MSRITNPRWNPGTTITKTGDTGVDTKFAAFETATANINQQNVRSEGIDVGNIYSNPGATGTSAEAPKTIVIKLALSGEKTSTTVVNNAHATASPGAIEVLPAANIALAESFSLLTTDRLRVYYTVTVGGWPVGFRPQNATVLTTVAGKSRDNTGGLFWLVWPEVATGGTVGSPSGWTRIGSQPDPAITAATGQISMATSTTVMPIPHFMYTTYWASATLPEEPIPIPPVVGASPDLAETQARASYSRGCFSAGSAVTITGIRLMMKGLYHMTTGGPADSRFDFASGCSSYNGTGAVAPPLQKVNITYSSMAVIAMRQN